MSETSADPSRQLRRRLRAPLGRVLARALGRRDGRNVRLDPAAIREVVVVRPNGRMGNTLFLTPLLAALHELLPHAAVDVLVNYVDAVDVLRGLPGLRDVIVIPQPRWRNLGRLHATLRRYRSRRYDLVIDPQARSTGGRIAAALARSRWRLGFAGEDQWLRLDFAARLPADVRHEALRPLALLEQAFGLAVESGRPRLVVGSSPTEMAAGAERFVARIRTGKRQPEDTWTTVGFFASARGDKDLGPQWWRDFWRAYLALRPRTVPIEVLPTAGQPPVDPEFATVHCASPRELAATIAHADWFFSADTGPMHLASAAGVPTIAFFERTSPAAYGPIKPEDASLRIRGMTPQDVAAACADIVARRAKEPSGTTAG